MEFLVIPSFWLFDVGGLRGATGCVTDDVPRSDYVLVPLVSRCTPTSAPPSAAHAGCKKGEKRRVRNSLVSMFRRGRLPSSVRPISGEVVVLIIQP